MRGQPLLKENFFFLQSIMIVCICHVDKSQCVLQNRVSSEQQTASSTHYLISKTAKSLPNLQVEFPNGWAHPLGKSRFVFAGVTVCNSRCCSETQNSHISRKAAVITCIFHPIDVKLWDCSSCNKYHTQVFAAPRAPACVHPAGEVFPGYTHCHVLSRILPSVVFEDHLFCNATQILCPPSGDSKNRSVSTPGNRLD